MSEVKILTKKNLIDILKLVLPKGGTSSSEKKYPFLFIKDDPDFRDGTILYNPKEHYFVQAPNYDIPVDNEYNIIKENEVITGYQLWVTDYGNSKAKVAGVIHKITGLSLQAAKDLVENTPCLVISDIKENEYSEEFSAIDDVTINYVPQIGKEIIAYPNPKLRFNCMGKTYRYTGHDFINVALEALPTPTRVSTRPVTINSIPGIAYPVSRTGLKDDPDGATILLPHNSKKEVNQYDLKNMYWLDEAGGIQSLISYYDGLGTVEGDTLTLGPIDWPLHIEHAITVYTRCNFIAVRYKGEKKIFYGIKGYERKKFDTALIWKKLRYDYGLDATDAQKRTSANSSSLFGQDYVHYYLGPDFEIQVQEWGRVYREYDKTGERKRLIIWRHLTGNSISTRNGKKRALIRMRIIRDRKHTKYAPSDWVYMHVDFRKGYMPVPSRQKRVCLKMLT